MNLSTRDHDELLMDAQDILEEQRLAPARALIEGSDRLCYDIAAGHGQIFGNVKHMRWFEEAVAKELT